jgi:ribose 5-phosphate isomerase RpiB
MPECVLGAADPGGHDLEAILIAMLGASGFEVMDLGAVLSTGFEGGRHARRVAKLS